jgi:inositol-hexakisphosphate/diphosphoinositol-pentakisphosphate 1-kinase
MSAGGGSKRLFRKVNNRSSEFYRHENEVRKEGSYIYEEFLNTQGTDVKVYTVGADYGHAEARKSPVVDGKVHRDAAGLEVRYPVILSHVEKEISRTITLAFKQTVCGFDFLRIPGGKSYVCDVNGWSFVKKNRKYYDDCSRILSETMLLALRPTYHPTLSTVSPLIKSTSFGPSQSPEVHHATLPHVDSNYLRHSEADTGIGTSGARGRGEEGAGAGHVSEGTGTEGGSGGEGGECDDSNLFETIHEGGDRKADDEELLCVVSVIRHGDRTPKQKMKVQVWDPRYLEYFNDRSQHPKQNLKLKSKKSLEEFLDVTKTILSEGPTKWYGNTDEMFLKLQRMKDVLEQEVISGVNRKLQLKPKKWVEMVEMTPGTGAGSSSSTSPTGMKQRTVTKVTHLMIILKWGGVLTPLGELQAEKLGTTFRTSMYPDPSGGGVLRLHSTFRHDLKIKSSDEGRVMKTAAAFTKGLLELEGDLTPVLVSLVSIQGNQSNLLDHSDNKEIKEETEKIKTKLNLIFQRDQIFSSSSCEQPQQGQGEGQEDEHGATHVSSIAPLGNVMMREALVRLHNPRVALQQIHSLVQELCQEIEQFVQQDHPPSPSPSSAPPPVSPLYLQEAPLLMLYRWQTLSRDFYSVEKDSYDLSKVPELHDMTRYDTLHNYHLPFSQTLYQLHSLADTFARCIVPQEYGINLFEKQKISHLMCHELLKKICNDIRIAQSGSHLDMHYLLDHSHAEDLDIRSLGRNVRTRLYFTSESHLYTLLNVLQYPLLNVAKQSINHNNHQHQQEQEQGTHTPTPTSPSPPVPIPPPSCLFDQNGLDFLEHICELSYLTQITIRLFEISSKSKEDPERYRCEISLSAGVVSDPCSDKSGMVSESFVLNSHVRCNDLLLCLAGELKNSPAAPPSSGGAKGGEGAGGYGSDDGEEC